MSKQLITAIRVNVDCLKRANIINKAEIAETIIEGMLSMLTDLENRLAELEKENG